MVENLIRNYLYFLPQYRSIGIEPSIIESKPASTYLTDIGHQPVFERDVCSTEANSINPLGSREIESTFNMKWLRYDSESSCEREHLLGTHHRVECPESCVVKCDIFFGDTGLDKSIFHIERLII